MAILEIKNLRVDYQTDDALVHALNDVNLKMEKGKTLGLVGETGAGKTTLAKCIMGILPQRTGRIRSGEIFYEGKDLLKTEEHEKNQRKRNCNDLSGSHDVIKSGYDSRRADCRGC